MTPLLQEAAKVLYASEPWDTVDADGNDVVLAFEELDEHAQWMYVKRASVLLRWHLTREPTEGMKTAAKNVLANRNVYAEAVFEAMNAALLKEVEG